MARLVRLAWLALEPRGALSACSRLKQTFWSAGQARPGAQPACNFFRCFAFGRPQPEERPTALPAAITNAVAHADSLGELRRVLKLHAAELNNIHVCAALSRLPKIRVASAADERLRKELLELLDREFRACVRVLGLREVSNTIWAWAKLDWRPPAATMDATVAALLRPGMLNPPPGGNSDAGGNSRVDQNIANLAWAYARLELQHPQLLNALMAACQQRIPTLEPQHLANVAWAFAKMDTHSPQLFDRLEQQVLKYLPRLEPLSVAMLVWAFAKAAPSKTDLLSQLVQHATSRPLLYSLTPGHLSYLMAGLAMAGHYERSAMEALLNAVLRSKQRMSAADLANALGAVEALGHSIPEDMLGELAGQLPLLGAQARPKDLMHIAMSLARLAQPLRPPLCAFLADMAAERHAEFDVVQLCKLASALHSLGIDTSRLRALLMQEASSAGDAAAVARLVAVARNGGFDAQFADALGAALEVKVAAHMQAFSAAQLASVLELYRSTQSQASSAAAAQLAGRAGGLSAEEVVGLLGTLHRLRHQWQPGPALVEALTSRALALIESGSADDGEPREPAARAAGSRGSSSSSSSGSSSGGQLRAGTLVALLMQLAQLGWGGQHSGAQALAEAAAARLAGSAAVLRADDLAVVEQACVALGLAHHAQAFAAAALKAAAQQAGAASSHG